MPRKIFTKQCKSCGKEFTFNSSLSKKQRDFRKFCNKKCLYKSKEWKGSIFKDGHIGYKYWKGISGKNHPAWSGGKSNSNGYVLNNGKNKLEHRLVTEKHLGRKLKSSEIIHHVDGNRSNNSIDNLELCKNRSEHQRKHHQKYFFKCFCCGKEFVDSPSKKRRYCSRFCFDDHRRNNSILNH